MISFRNALSFHWHRRWLFAASAAVLLTDSAIAAKTYLIINSAPPGATVELNGDVGTRSRLVTARFLQCLRTLGCRIPPEKPP